MVALKMPSLRMQRIVNVFIRTNIMFGRLVQARSCKSAERALLSRLVLPVVDEKHAIVKITYQIFNDTIILQLC